MLSSNNKNILSRLGMAFGSISRVFSAIMNLKIRFLKKMLFTVLSASYNFLNLDKYSGRFPRLRQWKKFFSALSKIELIILAGLILVILGSGFLLSLNFYYKNTEIKPAYFGQYFEAIIGQPRFVNPLFSSVSDADRDITQIVFSGLFTYDQSGEIVPDLAENFEIKEEGKVYEIALKNNVKWHDGAEFSADDVLFTFRMIQDPKIQSPQRTNWQGVKIEKIDNSKVRFILANPYVPFIENLTQQIIPKHIWENVLPENFTTADFNLKPIGTGPYQFKAFFKDEFGLTQSYALTSFDQYYKGKPYLREITFRFQNSEEEILAVISRKEALGTGMISPRNINKILEKGNFSVYPLKTPRYFAIFFNQTQSKALADKNVRQALSYATDKNEIISEVLNGKADGVDTALPPSLHESSQNVKIYGFLPEYAKEILEGAGWRDENSDGFREKIILEKKLVRRKWIEEKVDEIPLEIAFTSIGTPELESIAFLLKDQWEKIGAKVNVEIYGPVEIQQEKIRPRNYQALLFGEILGMIPDPFSFWHSSQKKDPGLNLALYDNKETDRILEEARQTSDAVLRSQKYGRFQEVLAEDLPAIFLYSPDFLYAVNNIVKGVEIKKIADPSKRFIGIEKWFLKTGRAWK